MKKKQAVRCFAAALALVALAFTAAGGNARADTAEPDYLVLNPEND